LASVVIDDYRNQFQRAYIKLLEIAYFNKKYSIRQKQITKKRAELRNKLLNRLDECQIKKCKIKQKACLVASHIWAVNKILSEQGIK
jgi:hypothetical protein